MADQDHYKTYVRETRTTENSGGLAFIVGGLIVAVGFILWFVFGALTPQGSVPVGNDTTTVTIEPPVAAPATDVEPVAPATPDSAEPTPAD